MLHKVPGDARHMATLSARALRIPFDEKQQPLGMRDGIGYQLA
jgi:hypothetical protein